MTRRNGSLLKDIILSPWWLIATMGGCALIFSNHLNAIRPGLFQIGPMFAPLFKVAALVFFAIAIVFLFVTIVKSYFSFRLGRRFNSSPKGIIISIVVDLIKHFIKGHLRDWEDTRRRTAHADNWGQRGPHIAEAVPRAATGKAAIIGESGAWLTIAEKLQARGLNVHKIEDIQPLLGELRSAYQPWVAKFHTQIANCIRLKNSQIAALRAEPGFFTTIINWFLVFFRKWDIARLYKEEEQYARLLSGNIELLDALQNSPELAGAKAELEVIAELRGLPADCTVFNNVQLKSARFIKFNGVPLQSAQLDHLVLSPAGVFVIETKRWSKQFAESGQYHDPFNQVQRAGYLCYDLLRSAFGKTPVRSIILCAGFLPEAPEDSRTKVLQLSELNSYIRWFNREELTPGRMHDLRQFFGQYVVNAAPQGVRLANGNPAEILYTGFLRSVLDEVNRIAPGAAVASARYKQTRGVLIPTEPPPLKPQDDRRYMPPAMRGYYSDTTTSAPCLTSVARTITRVCGAPEQGLEHGAAEADARVMAHAPAAGVKKLLIYAPDAIGRTLMDKHPAVFSGLEANGFIKFPVQSMFPSKTPVCYASMFTGLKPEGHGIQKYEKPALACKTVFDVLPAYGLRTAIVAVKDSSIDLLFRGRKLDYYSEPGDQAVTARALELIQAGGHDCILVYHQEYDDILHASDPWNEAAIAAAKRHVLAFEELTGAFDRKWKGLSRAALFAPDHGAHTDPATGKGTHGANIPGDMEIAHFWKFQSAA